MPNRLKKLRKEAHISMRDMLKYTGISNPVISYLENGQRPFRQEHINKLSAFFNVTADFLLGRTDYGYIVYPEHDSEEIILTESEYIKLLNYISIEIIRVREQDTDLSIETPIEQIDIALPQYVVYRELKGNIDEYNIIETLNKKLYEMTKKMTTEDLKKTIKFIEEYIIK